MTEKPLSRSEQAIRFIESTLVYPDGKKSGQPVRLVDFQRDIIQSALDPVGTDEDGKPIFPRRLFCSLPRKNSKTFTVACLLICFLCGPCSVQFGKMFSTGTNLKQARLTFDMAKKMIEHSPTLKRLVEDKLIVIRNHLSEIEYVPLESVYRSLAATKGGSLGTSPIFVAHDEVGLQKGSGVFQLYEDLETGSAMQENPLTICISTQSPSDSDWFSIMIDKNIDGANPRNIVKLYTCPKEVDWKSEEALSISNPLWEHMNQQELRDQQADAINVPSRANSFRNFHLNQRVKSAASWVSDEIYLLNTADPDPIEGQEVFGGLDLSEKRDLTALTVAYQVPGSDKISVRTYPFMPENTIEAMTELDREAYDVWVEEGLINATPGGKVKYEYVAEFIYGLSKQFKFRKIGYDAYRFSVFEEHLRDAGFSEEWIKETFVPINQGFGRDEPEKPVIDTCIDVTENYLEAGALAMGNNPVMRMSFTNVAIFTNNSGQKKFEKGGYNRRYDPVQALAMGVLMFNRFGSKPEPAKPEVKLQRLGSNRLW